MAASSKSNPKEKAEPAENAKAGGETAAKGKKAKKKGGFGKFVVVFFILALIGSAGTVAYLSVTRNLFEGRDKAIAFLQSFDPAAQTLLEREQELETRSKSLDAREGDIVKEEERLEQLAYELELLRASLEGGGSIRTSASLKLFLEQLSEDKITELRRVGTIYSRMDAQEAADIITRLDNVFDMAVVVYYMKPQSAAAALSLMSAELAAQVVETMLG